MFPYDGKASGFFECRNGLCGVSRCGVSLEPRQGVSFWSPGAASLLPPHPSSLPPAEVAALLEGCLVTLPYVLKGQAGSRGLSREKFRCSQRGEEENRPSAGAHFLCPPAHSCISDLISCHSPTWVSEAKHLTLIEAPLWAGPVQLLSHLASRGALTANIGTMGLHFTSKEMNTLWE